MVSTGEENRRYDFEDPENAGKWRGMFQNAFRKILEQEHPDLTAEETALDYVETLCLQLLNTLCAPPAPLSIPDIENRISKTLPQPIDKWATNELRETQTQPRNRRRYILPVEKVHNLLQREVMVYKIDITVTLVIAAIVEYISTDILRLSGNFVKKILSNVITYNDIKTAMCADKVLIELFCHEPDNTYDGVCVVNTERRKSLSYADVVRDLMTDIKTFLRDLNLIIRVFKDEIDRILDHNTQTLSLIFGNILDIYELTLTLQGNLEDAVEVLQDSPTPYLGSCFEDLLEVQEFYSYERYAQIVTTKESRDALQQIVDDPVFYERLATAGHGFGLAVKYFLPKLLLTPLTHVYVYHTYARSLLACTPNDEDKDVLRQVESDLNKHMNKLNDIIMNTNLATNKEITMPVSARTRRQLAIEKCHELSKLIDRWDMRDMGPYCNEFYREIKEIRIGSNLRQAFLFDGVLLLCKPQSSLTGSNPTVSLKLKEKLHVKKLDIIDKQDTEDYKNCVELNERSGITIYLSFATAVDKKNWIADLVILNTKPMLDRTLDSILTDLERRHPLKLPPPEMYKFSEPDSPANIILEYKGTGAPLIKGATLEKLVERLTYHVHADLALVRSFLVTYRMFCTPTVLLELLIERFNIPDPNVVYDDNLDAIETDAEKLSKSTIREDWKRYRKEFQQPVKFRVINVLRHWVDQHYYDFQRDPELLKRLMEFLEPVNGRPMRKWVQSVMKIIERRKNGTIEDPVPMVFTFSTAPPPIIKHVADVEKYNWHPLTLHPVELARQLTLLEFHLYRQVKPSEVVGSVWTKFNKEEDSPNLLRAIRLTTNLTRWMQRCIVECQNLEERVATLSRFLDMACELRHLNNFNGVLAVVATCASASIHRLRITFQMLSPRLVRALETFNELNSDHFKRYNETLKSINPPCVPFFGKYLTEIIHIEEGNKDFIGDTNLVNFHKRRLVADIISEIQQYQNQPYCLTLEKNTRKFLETLNPFKGKTDSEIGDYLYEKSLEIEPRETLKQRPKFARQYPELSLKNVKRHHTEKAEAVPISPILIEATPPAPQQSASIEINHIDKNGPTSVMTIPRLERGTSSAGQTPLADKKLKNKKRWSGREEPPSPRDRYSPRSERSASCASSQSWRPQALHPRGAVIDADAFYSISPENRRWDSERVPPLPSRVVSSTAVIEAPPPTPPKPKPPSPPSPTSPLSTPSPPSVVSVVHYTTVHTVAEVNNVPASETEETPDPPERPPPSPMHHDLYNHISPATTHDGSPLSATISERSAGSVGPMFSFPSSPAISELSLLPGGVPPPLPPRRVKPPPLPPRRSPQHQQLPQPEQGAIWQRRQQQQRIGPELPPKPVVAPRST